MPKKPFAYILAVIVLATGLLGTSCNKPTATTNSAASASSPAEVTPQNSPLTGFQRDLQFVRNGQFTYIWVFSRKDGKPLDKDDAAYLRTNAPQVVDWVTTDNGKRVIAGTNFNLEEGNLNLIRKRFVVENYSGK
jgi:hypothetical protein